MSSLDKQIDLEWWGKRVDRFSVNPPSHSYPPPPSVAFPRLGQGRLPRTSGIYFYYGWDGVCTYVGQAKNLAKRCGNRDVGELVTFIEFPEWELDYAEAYYIGLLRPTENFGPAGKKRRALAEKEV